MNKNKILILSLVILLLSLTLVSASDNNDTSTNPTVKKEQSLPLARGTTNDNKANINERNMIQLKEDESYTDEKKVSVKEGNSIQKVIDEALPGSTIIVEKGKYSEDLTISKQLSLIGENAIINSEKIAFNITQTGNKTSISGFNIIMSNSGGTGIMVNASDCKIINNNITGGNIGILADMLILNNSGELEIDLVSNITVIGNNVSNQTESGISIKAFNPIVSFNNVSNIINRKENGTATGILVAGNGVSSEDLNVNITNNHATNIKSYNNTATGMDLAGNSVFDTLVNFDVYDNTVDNVFSPLGSTGVNVGIFSLNTTLPTINIYNINVSNISSKNEVNASVTGMSVSVTTIGQNESSDTKVYNNIINCLDANGTNATVTGLDVTGVGCVDLHVSNNTLNNFTSSYSLKGISTTGIDYTNFNSYNNVSGNLISNISSSSVKGITVLSLGDANITKNRIEDVTCDNSSYITGVTLKFNLDKYNITVPQNATFENIQEFLNELEFKVNGTNFTIGGNLSLSGNNLEGNGHGTAFAVIVPASLKYNRATNFEYFIVKDSTRSYLLESYGYDPSMSSEELAYILLKSQQQNENYTEEELRNMSVSLGAFLDKVFGDLDNYTSGNVDARYNYWGSNPEPSKSKFKSNNGTLLYDPWLTLRVNAKPEIINLNQYSRINADVYMDSIGFDHSGNASSFFSGRKLVLSADKGSFNAKKSIILDWKNGKTSTYFKGDKIGIATITAFDQEKVETYVHVLGKTPYDDGKKYYDNYASITKRMPITKRVAYDNDSIDVYIKAVITTKKDDEESGNNLQILSLLISIILVPLGIYTKIL